MALDRVRAFEAAALAVLAETVDLSGVRRTASRPSAVISHLDLDEAVAELEVAGTAGLIPAAEAAARRGRLLALGEAMPRLRALRELWETGYLTDADLARKRQSILAQVSALLFGS